MSEKGSKSPISRVLCPATSGAASPVTVIPLGPALPPASSDLPGEVAPGEPERAGRAARTAIPLFGLAPHGVCRAPDRHRPGGALLPHRFTLTSPEGGAVCFLLHFPSRHCASPLASMPPVGVRTFLSTRAGSDRAGLFDHDQDSTSPLDQLSRRRKMRLKSPPAASDLPPSTSRDSAASRRPAGDLGLHAARR